MDALISAALATARHALTRWTAKELDTALSRLTRSFQILLVTWTICVIALLIAFALMAPDVRHDMVEFVRALRGEPGT
ncbi:hypothetical protein ACFT2C_06260 [Promicromonospora sp. NPDC057138]|uniref:hypothetical protein n=1 Tax=Promicromonospora sp. NPDC057138 TaxID=3346031 RepID=UPI00363BB427